MANFLYYVPGLASSHKQVRDWCGAKEEFRALLDGATPTPRGCSPGPDGGPGCSFVLPTAAKDGQAAEPGHYPGKQTWHEINATDDEDKPYTYYVGWENDNPPRPVDLLRPKPLDGMEIELADGQKWTVPILHVGLGFVPQVFGLGPRGSRELTTIPEYDAVCSKAADFRERYMTEDAPQPTEDEYVDLFVSAMRVNYYVGEIELLALKAISFDWTSMFAFWSVIYGTRALDEIVQKKTDLDDTTPVLRNEETLATSA